jgi:heme-degrading monooxygenase HmoA
MKMIRHSICGALASLLLDACNDSDAERRLDAGDAPGACARGALEPDFAAMPLAGPGVSDSGLEPGSYVLSSTYLQVRSERRERFDALMQPIVADLAARPGLLALSLGGSAMCGTARTLTVWRDEVAMLEFVASDPHATAMAAVSEISRGGSVVTHWSGDEHDATWHAAVEHVAADDGPMY